MINFRERDKNMNTLDELLYYCREIEPVGALLLTGEWGCGKTYLIEHELKDALTDDAVVLRVSLFGISTPEEIHNAVKNVWIEVYYSVMGIDGFDEKVCEGVPLTFVSLFVICEVFHLLLEFEKEEMYSRPSAPLEPGISFPLLSKGILSMKHLRT